jgi:hypothetical protein
MATPDPCFRTGPSGDKARRTIGGAWERSDNHDLIDQSWESRRVLGSFLNRQVHARRCTAYGLKEVRVHNKKEKETCKRDLLVGRTTGNRIERLEKR